MRDSLPLRILVLAFGLTACAKGVEKGGRDTDPDDNGPAPTSMKSFFEARVQPRLDFCRTCHVSGGIADVEDGHDYLLSGDRGKDLENLEASWSRLGGNNPTSRLLLMASGQETPHTGGKPWPVDSDAYADVEKILNCFADQDGCGAILGSGNGGGPITERALLGSQHGGHAWFDFCATRPDSAVLPPDPRSLVQPGANEGKAVHFNAYWRDCRKDPALIGEAGHPKTCGDLRESYAIGETLMRGNGGIGAGTFFAGSSPGGAFSISADDYNNLWRLWGLSARPDNFDQLATERYGVTFGTARNPYPKPGEDPKRTNGGTGQLPGSMTQTHDADGSWSGRIGLTCHGCHSGGAGTAADGPGLGLMYGSGNSLNDTGLVARELGLAAKSPIALFSLFGTSRGTNNASDVNVFFLTGQDNGVRLDAYTLAVLTSGSTASTDTPAWWNLGHRPLKFQDGFFATDANRVDIIFYTPLGGDPDWVRAHAQPADHWVMSLKSPAYPMPIDNALAEQGAILFHSKDLWASSLHNPAPKPEGGNGSCASCHGAYSPRYVNDPAYLDDPALEGVAAYIVPKSVIRTDPERVDTNSEAVNQYGETSFLGYSEVLGTDQDCGPQNRSEVRGARAFGYLAPPLYGVWATAPYLHNGSVPNLWTLLKPDARPEIWRRVSTPARSDQAGHVVMGFDTNLQRAYDPEMGGWKYDVMACGVGTIPYLDCNPGNTADPILQMALGLVYSNVLAAWNVGNLPVWLQWTNTQIENRKIYNTHLFSQGNEGHDFTSVLTDLERRALIEYLKTL